MHVVTKYPDGMFSWVDLSTNDTAGAKAFYSALFGWDTLDVPIDENSNYTMLQIDGQNVAGLGPMGPDMEAAGAPPAWSSYINHSDVDGVTNKAAEAGGTIIMPPMDVLESGRMSMVQGPAGAVFGIWQPKNHIGANLVNMPNTLVWNELATKEPEKAQAFYEAVFGWGTSFDDGGYGMYAIDGRVQAGMITMTEEWGEIPPHWAVYFMVDDVEAKAAKAKELGGEIARPATPAGEMGKFAVIRDPQGAVFTIMQFSGPVDPPPGA